MTELESALLEVSSALETCGLPFILIGGLAVTAWGEARSTLDVDISVWVEPDRLPEGVRCLCQRLQARPEDPLRFVEETRVLPLQSKRGVRIDVIFGASVNRWTAAISCRSSKNWRRLWLDRIFSQSFSAGPASRISSHSTPNQTADTPRGNFMRSPLP